jgi:hypothetical protein
LWAFKPFVQAVAGNLGAADDGGIVFAGDGFRISKVVPVEMGYQDVIGL